MYELLAWLEGSALGHAMRGAGVWSYGLVNLTHILGVSALFLSAHHVLVRAMAHGHVAHALLATGNAPPPPGAAALAIGLVVVRFVTVIIVPGLVLAAGAEIVAYLLVGPKRTTDGSDDDALSA